MEHGKKIMIPLHVSAQMCGAQQRKKEERKITGIGVQDRTPVGILL
jgi:hypothetical protein